VVICQGTTLFDGKCVSFSLSSVHLLYSIALLYSRPPLLIPTSSSQPGAPEPPPYEEAEQLASIPTPRVLTMMTSLTSRNRQTRGNRSTFEEAHESVAKFLESLLRRSQCPDWICWGYWWSFLSGTAHSSQVTISPSTPPESSQKTHFGKSHTHLIPSHVFLTFLSRFKMHSHINR
jgi:hypothetical protein